MIPPRLRARLDELKEDGYAAFQARLICTRYEIEGVRIPALRSLVKAALPDEIEALAFSCDPETFEEVLLCGFALGRVREKERVAAGIFRLLPAFDNWAHVDCVTCSLAAIKHSRAYFWERLAPLARAEGEFFRRFYAVALLDFFTDEEYFAATLEAYGRVKSGPYYVDMALGWGLSVMMTRDFAAVTNALERGKFSPAVTAFAVKKGLESRRLSAEQKRALREFSEKRAQTVDFSANKCYNKT